MIIFFNQCYLEYQTGKKGRYFSVMYFMQCNHRVLQVDHRTHFRTFTIMPGKKYLFSTIVY